MKRLYSLPLILLLFVCANVKAQTYTVPVNYKLNSKQDYIRYEADVVKTVDWLQDTPWTEEPQKRREATDFLFKWVQGTPSIIMELMPMLINLTDKNNKLMATFMGAYAKYAIEHPGYNKDEANLEAVRALIAKYRIEPTHVKDIDVERLIKKIDKNGELEDWVQNEYEKTDIK